MAHFFPLTKLPTAKETAEVMLTEVFSYMDYPWMWSLREDHNLSPNFGKPSVHWLESQ